MAERIFTLFGEEIVPEQQKAVGKSRAKKKDEEKKPEEKAEPEVAEVASEPETAKVAAEPTEPVAVTEEKKFELPDDWKGDKKYYSIGEVAALFKVKTSHIRFWTNEFKLKVRTTRKGDRLYTPEQVRELRTIHHLVKERGFTLTGAKAKLKTQNKRDVETIDLKQSLLQLRNKLVIIKNQLAPLAPKGE
ncbi:MAG: MerR family transcriptional regulator [Flavipsychrobacter sp.]|jgi:DNA-binding transcriptional MerR regulator|nr:MerR family transcriptional regulator [Flavipsychrobacter sp.]